MTRNQRQEQIIENWKKVNCVGTCIACTGFGKTKTALDAIQRVLAKNPNIKVVVIVPTQVLQEQWKEKLNIRNFSNISDVLILNTAAKRQFKCDFLILDEAHRCAASTLSRVFLNCKPTFILGLTATYERLDGREKIILDKYCPVFDAVTIKEAEENGWVSPYREYKVFIDVDLTEYNKANQTFMSAFAFFNFEWDKAMKCCTDAIFRNKYAKQMGYTTKEVSAKAFAWNKAMQFRKRFIADHPKKIEVAKKILEARKNTKAITFNSSIKQCEAYGYGYIIHSKKSTKENKQILEEFAKSGPGTVLHNSKMAKEGYDCPGINLVIITGFNSDKTSKVQTIGRGIRFEPNKVTEVFTLVIRGGQDEKWYKKASEGMDYIEINEKELDDILDNKAIDKPIKTQEKFTGLRF